MTGPTEMERQMEARWRRAAQQAVADGAPQEAVLKSMLAAAMKMMLAEFGAAAMAQTLGLLAVACHDQAGGAIEELLPGEEARDAQKPH